MSRPLLTQAQLKDRTTAIIHQIVEDFGGHDNRAFIKALKDFRKAVVLEVHYEYGRRLRGVKTDIEALY